MEFLSKIINMDKLIKSDVDRQLYNLLSIMFFCSIFAYYCVRNVKDTLALDTAGSSSIISNLKWFGSLPASVVIFFLYALFVNRYGIKKLLQE